MTINKILNCTIVGGGSSAWLTAAHLLADSNLNLTIIDKELSTPIGVGEATILNFDTFMNNCGFNIDEWFNEIDASIKCAIYFPDWIYEGNQIWHPFESSNHQSIDIRSVWSLNQNYSIRDYGSKQNFNSVIKENKIDASIAHGYHVDAAKLAFYIRKKIKDKVTIIDSEVVVVNKTKNSVDSLILANGITIKSDLYIDCTGFKSLLNPNRKTNSLKDRLFVNTAVAGIVQYKNVNEEQNPYTTAHAVDIGWIWKIPTKSRIGTGLVFNKSITSVDDAKDFLCSYWGRDRITPDKLRVIDWTPYYNDTPWDGNVVSIGLSAGFIEPLESTGLALSMFQAMKLKEKIKDNTWDTIKSELYNLEYKEHFESCVDFVSLHYSKTSRTSEFWKFVSDTYKYSDRLNTIISLSSERFPTNSCSPKGQFPSSAWIFWLSQMEYPLANDNINMSKYDAEKFIIKHKSLLDSLSARQITHTEYLRKFNKT